jgi:hypothetical protein
MVSSVKIKINGIVFPPTSSTHYYGVHFDHGCYLPIGPNHGEALKI